MKLQTLLALGIFSAVSISAQTPLPETTRESDQASANFGYAVSSAGDVNGDGFNDVIVGAYRYDGGQTNEGRVFIYHGSASGLSALPAITLECDQANAYFGFSVSSAGDVNGDGYDDVIVGAYLFDNIESGEGRAFIYHGSASGILSTPAVTMESNQVDANFGYSVSTAGDINNDGYDDVIIGAYQYDNGQTGEGRAYIYMGSVSGINPVAAAIFESDQSFAYFGYSVSSAGDINGDGFGDVAIGAYRFDNGETNEGACYIWQGSATGISTTPSAIIEINQASASFGFSVSPAGDTDNDGFDDVIVGAPEYDMGQTNEGAAFIFRGSASGIISSPSVILQADQADADYGNSVSCAGDRNNDGYDDVIVGAYNFDNGQSNEGRAYIYTGGSAGINTISLQPLESNQLNAYFGFSVAGAGDVNGDGFDDMITGAYNFDNGQTDEGRVYIWNGYSCSFSIFYEDKDLDGYGNAAFPIFACEAPIGYSIDATDCNDANILINPATVWYIDEDADHYYTGLPVTQCTTPGVNYVYTGISGPGDCTDTDIRINPGLDESFDGIDNNCDGNIDEGISWTFGGILEVEGEFSDFGQNVSDAGDVNNDGYDDIIVGAMSFDVDDSNAGRAYIYNGSAAGLPAEPSAVLEGIGEEEFGSSVSGAGDINGDGYDDILVGVRRFTNGEYEEGGAYIFNGSASGIISLPSAHIESNQSLSEYGWSVSSAGDVNADGYSDVIVGAYLYDNGETDEGAVFIYHGSASGLDTTPAILLEMNQYASHFGYSVCGAGDVNSDGFDDIIVGSKNYSNGQTKEGAAFVYYGSPAGITTTGFVTLDRNQAYSNFGVSVQEAGDVNGDGYDDVIIGASYYDNGQTNEGRVYIYFGSATGIGTTSSSYNFLESDQVSAEFGVSVSGVGDTNGDGFADVIIGARNFDNGSTNEGRTFLYHGAADGNEYEPYITMESDQEYGFFGESVSGAGDVNGDGYNDIIVGASSYETPAGNSGAVFVFYFDSECINTYFADADSDDYGNPADSIITCLLPPGYVTNKLDCNDTDPLQNPETVWRDDFDGDHFSTGSAVTQCESPGPGYSFLAMEGTYDCDNMNAEIYPGANELQDGIDNNCDGLIDEGLELIAGAVLYSDDLPSYTGNSVSDAGDINGDGFADVIVGAYTYTPGGIALVYYGSAEGVILPADTLRGDNIEDDDFGYSVSGAGDINADGYDDIVVGAPGNHGAAFIYMGSDTGLITIPSLVLTYSPSYNYFARNVSDAGDVNGDGYADIIVSDPFYLGLTTGKVWIYYGSATGLNPIAAVSGTHDGYYGKTATGAGDINHDGYDDIVIGAWVAEIGEDFEGLVYVYYGSASGINLSLPTILQLDEEDSDFGYSVSGAGDVNGDGYADIIAGSFRYGSTEELQWEGKASVFHGSAAGIESTPAMSIGTGEYMAQGGYSVSGAGDINNDGFDDIVFGAPFYDSPHDAGRAYVYYGSAAGIDTSWKAFMKVSDDDANFGTSVSGAGDINNDGYYDLIIGAPKYHISGTTGSGAAFVYYGEGCMNVYYADADADGFGSSAASINACIVPAGFTMDHSDCDDSNASVYPSAPELCNSLDDNCNAIIDEDAVLLATIIPSGPVTYCKPGSVLLQAATGTDYTYQWKRNGMNIPGATASAYTSVNKTAYYQVQITTPACSDISDSLLITANPKLLATITNTDATNNLCVDPNIKLKANGGAGISWQWYKGVNPIPGATGQAYIVTIPGNYKVKTTNASGCTNTSVIYAIVNSCRETEDEINASSLYIYPNPAHDHIFVQLFLSTEENISDWDIRDINGKKILEGIYNDTEQQTLDIDVSHLAAGVYLFSFITQKGLCNKEFVVQ